jgi:hypothetical protein
MTLEADVRKALDRALREAGWRPVATDVYERRVTKQFELTVQFWIEPEGIEAGISIEVPRSFMALDHLGESEREYAVRRDPLERPVTVAGAGDIDTAVAHFVREIEKAAQRMGRYADVDTFIAALEAEEDSRDDAPVVVPVVLAVTGRKREARERARRVPGDFADRLDRWMAGERPPPPPGSEDTFSRGDVLRTGLQKARERQAESPQERAERPQASWGDVFRTGRTLVRTLRGEIPPSTVVPDRDREWRPVELDPAAQPLLEHARTHGPLPVLVGTFVEARVEPGTPGRLRVLVDGQEVGTVAAPEGAGPATVPARIQRSTRAGPLELAVQLDDG